MVIFHSYVKLPEGNYYSCYFPVNVYIDVENPWFPCENDLQVMFCFPTSMLVFRRVHIYGWSIKCTVENGTFIVDFAFKMVIFSGKLLL